MESPPGKSPGTAGLPLRNAAPGHSSSVGHSHEEDTGEEDAGEDNTGEEQDPAKECAEFALFSAGPDRDFNPYLRYDAPNDGGNTLGTDLFNKDNIVELGP